MSGRWMPMPVEAWPVIAGSLSGKWPRGAAVMDLRWFDEQVRTGSLKRIPPYRKLAQRWSWTGHQVRKLLRTEEAWRVDRTSPASCGGEA